MKLYFASANTHKKKELQQILKNHQILIPSEEGILFDPDETEMTFFGNALIKAKALFDIVKVPVIADDSGICIDALNGKPGIYSARYGDTDEKQLTSLEKNALVLKQMEGTENRTCRFICNMVLYLGSDQFISIQETMEGILTLKAEGNMGFGYDPIVYIPEMGKTVAELTTEEKEQYSHRGKAGRKIEKMIDFL